MRFPAYPKRPHSTGQARIRLGGRDIYLGEHGSAESWTAYARLAQEHAAGGGPRPVRGAVLTVADVVARFLAAAREERTNPDGSRPWSELLQFDHATRPLLAVHGQTPATEFGPRALKTVQAAMASGDWQYGGERRVESWSRRVANHHMRRIKTVWRWAESEELVPAGSSAALATVRGLRQHQHQVRELPKRSPVPPGDLERTLAHLNPVARDAVKLLALTGARPGELCRWTPADVIRGGKVQVSAGSWAELGGCWCVWLAKHKTAREGGSGRYILLSPAAIEVIRPYLERPADAPLFSPAEGEAARRAVLRAARKTPVQPSQVDRSKAEPAKAPGDHYTPASLTQAIQYAAAKAGVPKWSAYQCRHLAITRFASLGDAEAARILAGHSDLGTTRGYLVDDLERAARVLGGKADAA